MRVKIQDGEILPDILVTGCQNSIKLNSVDFPVPCGKCIPCKAKRRNEWTFRIAEEYRYSNTAFFVTLTYDDLNLPFRYRKSFQKIKEPKEIIGRYTNGKPKYKKEQYFKTIYTQRNTLNKKDIQDYIKRLRNNHVKYVTEQKGKETLNNSRPIRYYLCGEYGEKTKRAHYHLILFNIELGNIQSITKSWQKGFTTISEIKHERIRYVTKYMHKDFNRKTDNRQPPFSQMSKGRKNTPYGSIGEDYLKKHGIHHLQTEDLTVKDLQGNTYRLPKAFLKKLFINKEDRQRVSEKSYLETKENIIKEYKRLLKTHYNNDKLKYMRSKDSDLKRQLKTIKNSEQC